jgi:L-threonylcarbamoyladenylate synthase
VKTRLLHAGTDVPDPEALRQALEVLRAGGLVAFPTDTVYGLGALAFSAEAVVQLSAAKGRVQDKAIPVLLATLDDLAQVALKPSPSVRYLAARFWPGPLTLVVPRQPDLPDAVSATATVGVRIPDHPVALALLAAAGPLAVTSANRAGHRSSTRAAEVLADLEGRIELVLDGGVTPGGKPSTVVDCTGTNPQVLRAGPISEAAIWAAWNAGGGAP